MCNLSCSHTPWWPPKLRCRALPATTTTRHHAAHLPPPQCPRSLCLHGRAASRDRISPQRRPRRVSGLRTAFSPQQQLGSRVSDGQPCLGLRMGNEWRISLIWEIAWRHWPGELTDLPRNQTLPTNHSLGSLVVHFRAAPPPVPPRRPGPSVLVRPKPVPMPFASGRESRRVQPFIVGVLTSYRHQCRIYRAVCRLSWTKRKLNHRHESAISSTRVWGSNDTDQRHPARTRPTPA